jgi:hypothetical protein
MARGFYRKFRKFSLEGWVSLSHREFGIGFSSAFHKRSCYISINILFFELYVSAYNYS